MEITMPNLKAKLFLLLTGGILLVSGCSKPDENLTDSCLYITQRVPSTKEVWDQLEESAKMERKIRRANVKVKQLWPIHPTDISESNIPTFLRDPYKWYLCRDNEWEVYAISTNKGD